MESVDVLMRMDANGDGILRMENDQVDGRKGVIEISTLSDVNPQLSVMSYSTSMNKP